MEEDQTWQNGAPLDCWSTVYVYSVGSMTYGHIFRIMDLLFSLVI